MNPLNTGAASLPWYRERWPWILMAGPAIVIVAGFFTAWIAFTSEDGLVVDDYYKQGLAINQTLGRSDVATRLGISAQLSQSGERVRVVLRGGEAPAALSLRLVHPTRAGMDQTINLTSTQPGVYEGVLAATQPGSWNILLEARDWRLSGKWLLPARRALLLGEPPSR
jgi:hypothetical protein